MMNIALRLAQRVCLAALTLLIASVAIFTVSEVLPGNAATASLGREVTPEQILLLEQKLGLDKPAPERYVGWVTSALSGDLGRSIQNDQPVASNLATPLRNSAVLAGITTLLGIPCWIALGALAAWKRGRTLDMSVSGFVLAGVAVPEFVVGTVLILTLAIGLRLFPAVTTVSPNAPVLDLLPALWLPAITLIIGNAAYVTRTVRDSLIDAHQSESVMAARLRGLAPSRVFFRHTMPLALAPTINATALTVGGFIGGVVVVESLFNYPGLGTLAVNAVANHDLPQLQAVTLLGAAVWVAVSLVSDAIGVLINPRMRAITR